MVEQGVVFELVRFSGVVIAFASAVAGAPAVPLHWLTQLRRFMAWALRRPRYSFVGGSYRPSWTVERPNWLDHPAADATLDASLALLWEQHDRLFKEVGRYAELDQERMRTIESRLSDLAEAVDRRATEAQVHTDRLGRSALLLTVVGLVVSTYAAELAALGWPVAVLAALGAVVAVIKAGAAVRLEHAVRARSGAENPTPS